MIITVAHAANSMLTYLEDHGWEDAESILKQAFPGDPVLISNNIKAANKLRAEHAPESNKLYAIEMSTKDLRNECNLVGNEYVDDQIGKDAITLLKDTGRIKQCGAGAGKAIILIYSDPVPVEAQSETVITAAVPGEEISLTSADTPADKLLKEKLLQYLYESFDDMAEKWDDTLAEDAEPEDIIQDSDVFYEDEDITLSIDTGGGLNLEWINPQDVQGDVSWADQGDVDVAPTSKHYVDLILDEEGEGSLEDESIEASSEDASIVDLLRQATDEYRNLKTILDNANQTINSMSEKMQDYEAELVKKNNEIEVLTAELNAQVDTLNNHTCWS